MRFAGYALVALFCATLSWSATAVARAASAAATPSPTASPSEDLPFDDPIARPQGAIALSHLYPLPGPVRLRGDTASFDISIPLVRTAVLQAASVELHYTNSIALQTARSVLAVRFNEATLAQIHLDAAASVGVVTVNLPISLWRPGYNKLTIDVVQHYTDRCEDPNAPELWTEVDLFRSRLHYKVAPSSAPYLLSDLSSIFAPGLGGQSQVLLMTAPTPQADKLRSQALPFVAQALALRRQYAPLTVEQASWSAGGEGNPSHVPDDAAAHLLHVLVGTPDQLAPLLTGSPLPPIDGPKLLMGNVGDGRGRLIVTGRSPDEVIVASRNLAVLQDTLTPDTQAVFIPGQSPTGIMPLDGRSFLVGNTTYSFNTLGVSTTTIQGSGKNRITVPLPLPGDYFTRENAQAHLLLDFAYSAAMGAGSVINIRLNGEFVQGIFFNNSNGQKFTGYRLDIPVRLLRPGSNTLDFDVATHPFQVGGECTSQRGDDLFVQIMGTSTIRLPPAGHAAVLPDLVRLAAAGFPYVARDGSAAGKIYVASPELLGGALTLIGKLAQAVRGPVSGWEIVIAPVDNIKGQAIALGTADQLSADYYVHLAAAVAKTKRWPYRALQDLRTASRKPHLTLGTLWSAIFGRALSAPFPVVESLTQRSALGDLGVLFTLRNPLGGRGDTLTILTADTNTILGHRVAALVQPEVWSQMQGDLVAWQTPDSPVFTMAVGGQYQVGREDPWLLLRLTVSTNPLYWLLAAAIAAALATAAAFILLRRRGKRLAEGRP
jgi:cellulose synthase operon protein B